MRYAIAFVSALLLMASTCQLMRAVDKHELEALYKGKSAVVIRDGLSFGVCEGSPDILATEFFDIEDGMALPAKTDFGVGFLHMSADCNTVGEPLHKGELLFVDGVSAFRGHFNVRFGTVSAHAVTRGVAAMQHESQETGMVQLQVKLPAKNDYDYAQRQLEQWVKVFPSSEEAVKFAKSLGNTASGVFVKEIKLGMSFADVESVLGPPQTRIDLGPKVLYKYKDMTIEFHDGKVTDVR